ncbi:hypothetical protein B0H10DRAFT_2055442 [Mycena sp. CBHHK59/15]|nr:hypothetical protein B0H10DRAFT_2055442 [Mycena sp. CBHHK59/15]
MDVSLRANSSSKRARVDSQVDKENRRTDVLQSSTKKPRLDGAVPAVNPYKTLPPPSAALFQLRFQLARFKGVYRVAQVPLNYTFAHLHKLIQFMFGWHGDHMHRAKVYSHIEMYSGNYKAGHIKRYGKDAQRPDEVDAAMLMYWEHTHRTDIAEYEVVARGRNTRRVRVHEFDNDEDAEQRVEDQELRLSQVWNEKLRKNASMGACTNRQMGVIYEYDMGAAWTVHITMDRETDFFTAETPSNLPIMVPGKNKGAPPIEDPQEDVPGELEGPQKTMSPMFYDTTVFERYLKGEVVSRAARTMLKVYNREGTSARGNNDDVGGSGSDSDDEDGDEEEEESAIPSVSENRLALVPSTSHVDPEPENADYDDLRDADGEVYDSDEEERLDEEPFSSR